MTRTLAVLPGPLAVAACFLLAATSARAQVPPGGPEVLMASGAGAAAAVEADGGLVVVWARSVAPAGLVARRLDSAGVPRSGEIPVGSGSLPAVAANPAGGFLVVWAAAGGIAGRLFDADGTPAASEVMLSPAGSNPRVSASAAGYVVTWMSAGSSVMARLFDPQLSPRSGTVTAVAPALEFDVAMRFDGYFVVTWTESPSIANGGVGPVKFRFFDNAATAIGVVVNLTFPLGHWGAIHTLTPRIGMAGDGSFAVTWHAWENLVLGGFMPGYVFDLGPHLARLDGAGALLPPQILAGNELAWQDEPSLAVSAAGTITVLWSSTPRISGCTWGCWPPTPIPPPQDGSEGSVYGKMYSALGAEISGGEFRVNLTTAGNQGRPVVASAPGGIFAVYDSAGSILARRFGFQLAPAAIAVDPTDEMFSDGNGVLENWEAVVVAPSWRNTTGIAQALTSAASSFGGPAGPLYDLLDGTADFGVIANGATGSCLATGDCFVLAVSGARPAEHWDAELTESGTPGHLFAPRTRSLHIGDSFVDVPRASNVYRFVETVFHTGAMPAWAPGYFAPAFTVTRETMAMFVLKAANPAFVPPACVAGSERFIDVPASSPYCPWIEELARRNVVAGCGGGRYCPAAAVSRETMAVYLLLTKEGTGYAPPACGAPVFNDVPAASPFCRWIEELARRGIVAGCGNGSYCPAFGVARDQMSVFLTGTFGLMLYAP